MKSSNLFWIDPITNLQVCSLEGCRKKFKTKIVNKSLLTVVNGENIMYDNHISQCVECGRQHALSTDRQKTNKSKSEVEKSIIFLKDR